MSTTDLDPQSPLARFLAGAPVADPGASVAADPRGDRTDVAATTTAATAARASRTAQAGLPAAVAGPADALGGGAVRGVERRVATRLALLGGRTAGRRDLAIRLAGDADAPVIRFLAERDPAGRAPGTPLLVAEADGVAVAAIGIRDRRVLADPMADTAAAVDRLQARAAELRGPLRRQRWAARMGRRAA